MQDRMHLDCVFSIIGDDVCIMMDEMMGEESPTRRLVDEWVQVGIHQMAQLCTSSAPMAAGTAQRKCVQCECDKDW